MSPVSCRGGSLVRGHVDSGWGGASCTGETLPGSGWNLKMEPRGFAEGLDGECRERRAEDFMVCGSYTSEGDTVL